MTRACGKGWATNKSIVACPLASIMPQAVASLSLNEQATALAWA
jgi:hypothetical protein